MLLGLETGKHGFPSQKTTHPLLEALLPAQEDFPYAEERRLFYVALTRARQRAYLIADMAVASAFVVELLKNEYELDLDEFSTSLSQQLLHMLKCIKCKTGTMVSRQSQFGRFLAAINSRSALTRSAAAHCDSQMRRAGRFKVCINPDCQRWVPTCPKCGAEMTQRKGRNGEFWGAGTIGLRVRAAGIPKTGSCSIRVCCLQVVMKVVFRIKREYRDIRYVGTEILG